MAVPLANLSFQTSWSLYTDVKCVHCPAGAALRGPSQPLAPPSGTRAPAFLSVRALKKPTPRHRRIFHTRQPLASSTHDLDTMVTRWSAPIPLCTFVSSEQRTRVLSLFFRCLIMLVDFMPAVHLDTCPLCLHRHGRTTLSLISRPPSPLESAQPASHPNAQMHKSATSPNMPCGHTAVGR